jgi:hypothetical protein
VGADLQPPEFKEKTMTTETIKAITFGLYGKSSASRRSGILSKARTEVLKGLGGSQVRCTSGSIWVTIEGDPKDYILTQDQSLSIPNLGKVLLSGPGSYQV